MVDPSKIQVCNLSDPDGSWINQPESISIYTVAIDSELGRIALAPGITQALTTLFDYGFNADMGGGGCSREASFTASPEQIVANVPGGNPPIHAALAAIAGDGVFKITDDGTYSDPAGLNINVNANGHIELRAANGFRSTLILGGSITVTGGADSAFDLND
jgi:hypothetical protein